MRKKLPVPFAERFPNVDPLALRLLKRLLAFDPKDRPTAEEALADPYFKGLAKVEREPSCQPISKLEFEFERRRVSKEDIRELIYREILEYHPQLRKDYVNGTEGANFLYPSATGQLRKQFAYLQEISGRSVPVIPPERKHVSLPRSTVHSRTSPTNAHLNSTSSESQQVAEEGSKNLTVTSSIAGNPLKVLGPPPRVPTAKPRRVGGSVLPSDNDTAMNGAFDPRIVYRSSVLVPQTVSPHCYFKTNTAAQEKSAFDAEKNSTLGKPQNSQCNMAAKPVEST